MENMLGRVVKSIKGHDKGEYFIVVKTDDIYTYLADGKLRLLENSKKKKQKHIEETNYIDEDIRGKILEGLKLSSSDIREALENYKNNYAKGE